MRSMTAALRPLGLRTPEHHLAEQVDVHREAAGTKTGEVRSQRLRCGVGDQIAHLGAHPLACQCHDGSGRSVRDQRPGAQKRHVGPVQKGRTGAASQSAELARRDAGRGGPEDPITKGHDERN